MKKVAVLGIAVAVVAAIAAFFYFRGTPAGKPADRPETKQGQPETPPAVPPTPAPVIPPPPPPPPPSEAETHARIEQTFARLEQEKKELFRQFFAALHTGDATGAQKTFDLAKMAVDQLPEHADEKEIAAAKLLAEDGAILEAAWMQVENEIQGVFDNAQLIGMQIELPKREIAKVTALNRREVTVLMTNPEETRKLSLQNPVIRSRFIGRAARKLAKPQLEFYLGVALGALDDKLKEKAPDGFWKTNYDRIAAGYVPPAAADEPEEEAKPARQYYTYDDVSRAIYNQQFDQAVKMIELGTDVNSADGTGNTLLMAAANEGTAELIELLLKKGAKIDARTSTGRTALMGAVSKNRTEIIELLLKHQADPNSYDEVSGKTTLQLARDPKIIELLKAAGAKK
jgi:hypothetical protein